MKTCTACFGSGVYDYDGSPPCGACDGTGEVDYSDDKFALSADEVKALHWCREIAQQCASSPGPIVAVLDKLIAAYSEGDKR